MVDLSLSRLTPFSKGLVFEFGWIESDVPPFAVVWVESLMTGKGLVIWPAATGLWVVSGLTRGELLSAGVLGLAGRYLRSNGLPDDCPMAKVAMARQMAIPRMRLMTAKVDTSNDIHYLLHVPDSRMVVSPATSNPAAVPVSSQMI